MTYLSRHRSIRNTPYRLREQGRCIKNKLQQKKRKLECAFLIILAVHKFQFIHALYNKLLIIALLLFKYYKSKKIFVTSQTIFMEIIMLHFKVLMTKHAGIS